jgi:hypothetical protein
MINQYELKRYLTYFPDTGVFTWNIERPRIKKGQIAGGIHKRHHSGKSYCEIKINGRLYQAHRLAMLYMKGEFPKSQVDHIDGNGLNNRFSNLRNVTQCGNSKNRRLYKNNKHGLSGVRWNAKFNKYIAFITVNRKRIHLGIFQAIFDAACARKAAEKNYGFHSNHGSFRSL